MLDVLLAAAPILLILALMVGLRWGAAKAGPAAWLLAMALAAARFGAGLQVLAYAHVKALLLTMDVLYIVWTAFLLYRVSDEAGAIEDLGRALPHLTADRGMQALLIGWAFASFLQGVGGFGVPIAVTAPLLVGLGFEPLAAVVVPSLGHAWSVTFGSLGSSFQALMGATGLPGENLAPAAALLLGLAGLGGGAAVAHAADGWQGVRRLALPVGVMALAMGAAQYLLAVGGLWNVAGFGGGVVGLAVGGVVAGRYRGERRGQDLDDLDGRRVWLAVSAYLVLVALTILIQFLPPLRAALGVWVIRVPFPELETARGFVTPAGYGRVIPVLRHAGAILTYTSVAGYLIYRRAGRYRPGAVRRILLGTAQRVTASSLGVASMVAMAVVMTHAGMTDALARGLAGGVGRLFPLAAPWIGAVGAFMTGSNTNSNVVFGMLQMRTAELLGASLPWILAAQTTGGAIGSVIAPTKIIVGASTAGLGGREGLVLRAMAPYIGLLLLAVSLVVALVVGLG